MCESSYIVNPPPEAVPTFEVNEDHKEVILITGEARCVNTRETLVAPCAVPKTVRQLLMNTGSPKLLVISDKVDSEEQTPGVNNDNLNTDTTDSNQKITPAIVLKTIQNTLLSIKPCLAGMMTTISHHWVRRNRNKIGAVNDSTPTTSENEAK